MKRCLECGEASDGDGVICTLCSVLLDDELCDPEMLLHREQFFDGVWSLVEEFVETCI